MNTYLKNIIDKYKEFNNYVESINTEEFNQFTRTELIEFEKELRNVYHFKYITSDIDKFIKAKKEEEFPELLGVHHYPEIKELDCISDEDKINLDNYLCGLGFSSYIMKGSGAWRDLTKKWSEDIQEQVLRFLYDKQIIIRFYRIYTCCDDTTFSEVKVNNILSYYNMKDENGRIPMDTRLANEDFIEAIREEIFRCCDECDNEYEITKEMIENAKNNPWTHLYRIIKKRDTTFDNR